MDRWNPTTNPNGLIYGVHEESTDLLTILDPVKNSFTEIPIPSRNPGTPLIEPPEVLEAVALLGIGSKFPPRGPRHTA